MLTYAIAGAGFSGAVLARELATNLDCRVLVFDERPHVAGNCFTERDVGTDVMVHRYGPHIFNTNDAEVWDYVNRFGKFGSYINRVKASTPRGIFSFPINLHTINQFFGKRFNPAEAKAFLETVADKSIVEPANFEEQALAFIGRDLYDTFFYGYTKKQWGCEPRELPASILQRLPVRFNYNDCYYSTRLQGIPVDGYTAIVEKILAHPRIEVRLHSKIDRAAASEFDHLFWTGSIDAYFDHSLGRLGYRTVDFERGEGEGDWQGNAVINYPDASVPHTRIHEHKHFAPWETHERTVYFTETPKETGADDAPYYPKRLQADKELLCRYRELAEAEPNASFVGRLGTYRYMDMERVIAEALDFSKMFVVAETEEAVAKPTFPNSTP